MAQAIPYFERLTGASPYPWQVRCYERLLAGEIPRELTLPTGTGKTSVVLLYLLALAAGANLPRRLVYVVDRRAIVDQTTVQLEHWLEALATIPELQAALHAYAAFARPNAPAVEVGTLRGGLTDSGLWRLDPAKPAVLVGTVDIVGSRLLFAGYGDGRSRRPLHAGLLGVDATIVLDEAHLSPAFADTLRAVEGLQGDGPLGPRLRVMTMSATPREGGGSTLTPEDRAHPGLGARLEAGKYPQLTEADSPATWRQRLRDEALRIETGTVLLFVHSAQEAQRLQRELTKALGKSGEQRVGLLTGTLRGHERQALTESTLWHYFADPQAAGTPAEPVYLIATAAGEVGVDLDADHLVMDLAPMDALIQRLGRVNRAGRHAASSVVIVYTPKEIQYRPEKVDQDAKHRYAAACERALALLSGQDRLAPSDLLAIPPETLAEAASPRPRSAPLAAERLELLAATNADVQLPPVTPYLRGVTDEPEPPEVQLLWRYDLARLLEWGGAEAAHEALTLLPPSPRELLKAPLPAVTKALADCAERYGTFQALRVGPDNRAQAVTVSPDSRPQAAGLAYATLILPAEVGGLSKAGFLEGGAAGPVTDLADDEEGLRFEAHSDEPPETVPSWAGRAIQWRVPLHDAGDEEAEPHWWVYARRRPDELALEADTELTRLARQAETLAAHQASVGEAAGRIARALGLEAWVVEALEAAGERHDTGKEARVWQRAAGQRGLPPLAKSRRGQFRPELLGGYRHEFGSLGRAERELPAAGNEALQRELTLHLIAAHHGHARPGFPQRRQWDPELPDTVAASLAREAERRFARLQHHFGFWGLAWLEALLKCADGWVSSGYAAQEAFHG
ncbi:type I-U CRISPR-associated helicase/endonuclease Cas3 [Halorhodospira neutriphila]|uniref:Type I-U CRISPR-associated helicase/endonuclease Cas3 n=3 Tax=Pseudomonadota TaxID=1224 RepID=A0ABS1E3L9_9GAMM|nr:type I-U CRISPR-associated helicase/endonuclease Cas3 [Halorhodospira neutriphila]MBK1725563.1 type I-U CRISPR-associated helicase/endonuclease Cas3 [Halorhodospira neutriphila]